MSSTRVPREKRAPEAVIDSVSRATTRCARSVPMCRWRAGSRVMSQRSLEVFRRTQETRSIQVPIRSASSPYRTGSAPCARNTSSIPAIRAEASSSEIPSSSRSSPMCGERFSFPSVIAPAPPVRGFSSRTMTVTFRESSRAAKSPAGPAPMIATSQRTGSAGMPSPLHARPRGEPEGIDREPAPAQEGLDLFAPLRLAEQGEEHPAPSRPAELGARDVPTEDPARQRLLHLARGNPGGDRLTDRPLPRHGAAPPLHLSGGNPFPGIPGGAGHPRELLQDRGIPLDRTPDHPPV